LDRAGGVCGREARGESHVVLEARRIFGRSQGEGRRNQIYRQRGDAAVGGTNDGTDDDEKIPL